MSTSTTSITPPPWYRYAAKAVAAFAVAVLAAAGIITAALADDHVSTAEWWQIILAVLSALVGPAAVYAVRNDTRAARHQA